MKVMKNRLIKKTVKWARNILLGCFIITILPVIMFRFVPVPVTPLMIIRCFQQFHNEEKVKFTKKWVPLERISPHMVCAVIAAEDQNFTRHFGFDLKSIKKAYDRNKKGRLKGASTISMQTAKNMFLWPDRTWIRKGLEAYFTVLLEMFWSKERIVEVYLNIAEMGKGIYGIEAASKAYYNKPAADLSRREAAMIAVALPRPLKMNPSRPTCYMNARLNWVLHQMEHVVTNCLDLRPSG